MNDWNEIRDWRKSTRAELIERRLKVASQERQAIWQQAGQHLREVMDLRPCDVLGIYWPFRGEVDVRDIAAEHIAAGGTVALPVVVQKAAPLEFWQWHPEMKPDKGIWNIPIPSERKVVTPQALIIPLVGFDAGGYRLGYGGGYYDRTIAGISPWPLRIGLGYAMAELPTIHPQPHDIPMSMIVTEKFVRRVARAPSD